MKISLVGNKKGNCYGVKFSDLAYYINKKRCIFAYEYENNRRTA